MTQEEERGTDHDLKEQLAQQEPCRVVTIMVRLPVRVDGFSALLQTITEHFPETQLKFAADGAWLIEVAEQATRGTTDQRITATDLTRLIERTEADDDF